MDKGKITFSANPLFYPLYHLAAALIFFLSKSVTSQQSKSSSPWNHIVVRSLSNSMSLEKRLRKVCGQENMPRVRQSAVSPSILMVVGAVEKSVIRKESKTMAKRERRLPCCKWILLFVNRITMDDKQLIISYRERIPIQFTSIFCLK